MNFVKKISIAILCIFPSAIMIFGAGTLCTSASAFGIESGGFQGNQAVSLVTTSRETLSSPAFPETASSSLEAALDDARLNKLGISPESPNGKVMKRWAERLRSDPDIRAYFGDGSKRADLTESALRLTPEQRSKLIELSLKAFENAPPDCGGVRSESAVVSRYLPLDSMPTDDVDAYMGVVFAMFKREALHSPIAQITNEQRWHSRRVLTNTLEAQLKNDPQGMRDVAAKTVDPASMSAEAWCRSTRIFNQAIVAMPQPDRDWFLVASEIENERRSSGDAPSPATRPEIDVSAQGYALKVQRRVAPNIVWDGPTQGLETAVVVRCAPSGTLLSLSIVRKSGNDAWDKAALSAVQRSDPMPTDTGGLAPAKFVIRLRPSAW